MLQRVTIWQQLVLGVALAALVLDGAAHSTESAVNVDCSTLSGTTEIVQGEWAVLVSQV